MKQLKRAHSSEPSGDSNIRKSPHLSSMESANNHTAQITDSIAATSDSPLNGTKQEDIEEAQGLGVASPYKKQRPSMEGLGSNFLPPLHAQRDVPSATTSSSAQPATIPTPPVVTVPPQVDNAANDSLPQLPPPDADEEL